MPTPMPIMAAISGEKFGTVRTCVRSSSSAIPIPSPASAVITGRPMATTDPKASSMMMMAAVMPMPSLGPGAAVAAARDRAAAELDLEAVVRGGLGRGDDLLHGGGRDVGGVGRELDLGEGDVARARVGDLVGSGLSRRGWSRSGRRAGAAALASTLVMAALVARAVDGRGGVEDDVGCVARLRRELRLQDVARLLRGGVARRELVLEVGADDLGQDRDADDGQYPERQDGPAAVVAGAGQAPEDGGVLILEARARCRTRSRSPLSRVTFAVP